MIISSISWGIAKFGAWITVTSEVRLLWWTCFDQTFRMCDKWFYLGAFSITQILNPSNEAGATQEMRNLLRLVGDRDFTKLSSGHMVVWLYVNLQHWETLNAWQAVKIGTMWSYTLIRVYCCLLLKCQSHFCPFLNPNHWQKTFLVVHSVSHSGNTNSYKKW